jgi:hypothetical protein
MDRYVDTQDEMRKINKQTNMIKVNLLVIEHIFYLKNQWVVSYLPSHVVS